MGHFARLIPYLAENHCVYAIDLLGFGASDKPANTEYGPDLWAELVFGKLSSTSSTGLNTLRRKGLMKAMVFCFLFTCPSINYLVFPDEHFPLQTTYN